MPGETFRKPLGCRGKGNLAYSQRVITDDIAITDENISLRSACLLVLQSTADQEPIERFFATIEAF